MKTTLLIAVAVIGLTSASCRKERTCECKDTETRVTTSPTGNTTVTEVFNSSDKITMEKQYKGKFKLETRCYSRQYTDISANGRTQTTHDINCELK